MKTKSKLVLGLSILGAATLAAGTTSTFAWYVVTNTGTATAAAQQIQPSTATAKPTAVANLSFTLDKALTSVKSSKGAYDSSSNPMTGDMEMTRFLDADPGKEDTQASEDKFYFAYYLTGNTETEHWRTNQFSNPAIDFWRVYKIEYSIPSSQEVDHVTYDQQQIYEAISAKTFTITATPDNGSKAYLWVSDSTGALPATASAATNAATNIATNVGFSSKTDKLTAYVGVYVDGGNVVHQDSEHPHGNFTITLAEYVAPQP